MRLYCWAGQGRRRVEGGGVSRAGAGTRAEAAGARPGQAAPVDAKPPHAANCPPLHPQADPGIIIPRQQMFRILHIQSYTIDYLSLFIYLNNLKVVVVVS